MEKGGREQNTTNTDTSYTGGQKEKESIITYINPTDKL